MATATPTTDSGFALAAPAPAAPHDGRPLVSLPRAMDHQRSVLLSPARYKVVTCGRRWGKTALGLMATIKGHGPRRGVFRGAMDGGRIWWLAPTYGIASDIWRDLKRATRDAWIDKNEVERRITLPGGGSIMVKSTDHPDSLRGSGLDGVVLDEAAVMHESVWREVVRPALADRRGWAIFISTPKGANWFRDLFDRAGDPAARQWERWQRPTSDNPIIPAAEIDAARADMIPSTFAQEFEARFVTSTGTLFPRDKAQIIDVAPAGITRLVRYWDKAGSDTDGDFTAGVLMGVLGGSYYVLDVVHGRWDPFQRNAVIRTTCEADESQRGRHVVQTWIEQEPGNGGKESAMISVRDLARYGARTETPRTNKVARAEHYAAQWIGQNVRLLRAAWNAKYIDELTAFPDPSVHDDMVDGSSGAFNKLVMTTKQSGGGVARGVRSRI